MDEHEPRRIVAKSFRQGASKIQDALFFNHCNRNSGGCSVTVHAKLCNDRPYQHRNIVCLCTCIRRRADAAENHQRRYRQEKFQTSLYQWEDHRAINICGFCGIELGPHSKCCKQLGKDSLQEVLFLAYIIVRSYIVNCLTFVKNLSVIPILGVFFCAYLLIEIPAISWIWFFGWMGIGLLFISCMDTGKAS